MAFNSTSIVTIYFTDSLGSTLTSTYGTPASPSPTRPMRGQGGINAEAVRFFLVSLSIFLTFGLISIGCCLLIRRRRRQMKRVVVAALEGGVFDWLPVAEMINDRRRGLPTVLIPASIREGDGRPEIHEFWAGEKTEKAEAEEPAHSTLLYPATSSAFKDIVPFAARLRPKNFAEENLEWNALPVNLRLAHLYAAKLELKQEWKEIPKPRPPVPPYRAASPLHETDELSELDPVETQGDKKLDIYVVISMPEDKSTQSTTGPLWTMGTASIDCGEQITSLMPRPVVRIKGLRMKGESQIT